MMPLLRFIAVPLAALALLGGCADEDEAPGGGGATPDVLEEISELSGADRERALEERGREERGALRLYTSLEEDVAAAVGRAFERDTGIKVEVFRGKSEEVLERVSKEVRAGVDGADVVETGGPGLVVLDREDLLLPYDSPVAEELAEDADRGDWTVTRLNVFVASRNTRRVSEDEAPPNHEALADARWRGRLVMEADDSDWYLALRDHWMRSEDLSREEADARFEAIARNARVVEGHSLMDELLASGEFDVAVSDFSYLADGARRKGAPVAWRPPTAPVVSRPNGVALVRGAKRPARAARFVDWLLGPGQDVLAQAGIDAVRRDLVRDPGVEVVEIDPEDFVERQDEAADAYRRILRLAGKGPEDS